MPILINSLGHYFVEPIGAVMSKMTWFRLYHDIIFEIKMRRFSPQEKWAWVVLLCLASQSDERGSILEDDEDIADLCEFNTLQDWLYFKDKLRSKEMIEMMPTGLKISHWSDRQFQSDLSTDRVRKHREMQAQSRSSKTETTDETNGNGMKRFRNVSETPPDTDTYKDQELLEITEDHECIVDSQSKSTANAIAVDEKLSEEIQGDRAEEEINPESEPQVSEPVAELEAKKGAAAKKSQAEKKAEAEEAFRSLYNERKPAKWPRVQKLSEKRRRTLRQVCKDMGGYQEGVNAIACALDYARTDEWYRTRTLTFENFFTNGKVLQLYEKYLASHGSKASETQSLDLPAFESWKGLVKAALNQDVQIVGEVGIDIGMATVQVGDRMMTYRSAATIAYPVSLLRRRIEAEQSVPVRAAS